MELSLHTKHQLRRVIREAVGKTTSRAREVRDTATIAEEVLSVLKTLKSKIQQIDNPDIDDAYGALLSALKDELS